MNIVKSERNKRILKDVPPSVWEHPADRAALQSLRSVPGFELVMKTVFGAVTERSLRLMALASAVRVNDKQFRKLYELHREACQVLDMPNVPELYVSQSPFLNASAVGMDKPFIILNSSVVESLSDDEVLSIIGHELGHIKSGHVLYKNLLQLILQLSTWLFQIPLTGLALMGVITALREWDRKSELSADRAGLLVCQNPEVVVGTQMRLAGGSKTEEMNLGEFVAQAQEYKNNNSLTDSVHKLLNLLMYSHPFPVIRVSEILEWVQSGAYERILEGDYSSGSKGFYENMKEAGKSYADDIKETAKPISDDLKEKYEEAKKTAQEMFDKGKDAFDQWKNKK